MWKRLGSFLLAVAFALPLQADDGSLLQIQSLYGANGWVPGQLLPFRVTGSAISQGKFRGVKITSETGADCRVMRDPFLPEIFLLKCADTDKLSVEFAFEMDGSVYRRSIGPIDVKVPDPNFIVDPNPTGPPITQVGRQLYSSHCVSCHNPPASKSRRSAATIKSAIQTNGQMMAIPSLSTLTADELNAIAAYLGTL
ncbi:MAG: cytochrome c [Bdellovibrionaceae bacterium]|nr:cytochrome c [Pseudobdellovibrionaceae bacterium]